MNALGEVGPKLPVIRVVSIGRRNTQVERNLPRKQRLKSLPGVRSPGTLPWMGLTDCSQSECFPWGSTDESPNWMVLHRPVEPAAQTGQVGLSTNLPDYPTQYQRAPLVEGFECSVQTLFEWITADRFTGVLC